MSKVAIDLFADFKRDFAERWAWQNTLSGALKIKGVGKEQRLWEPWLDKNAFEAATENMHQRIVPQPRKVFIGKDFIIPVTPSWLALEVEKLLNTIRRGDDITPFLGNNVRKLGASDSMLNYWGIFHLHLKPYGQRIRGDDNHLIFAHINDDAFYAVGLGDHSDLMSTRFIKALQRDFPFVMQRYQVDVKSAVDIDSEAYTKCCERNTNTAVLINGVCYMNPGGGVVANGASAKACCEIIAMRKRLDSASEMLKKYFFNGFALLSKKYSLGAISAGDVTLKLKSLNSEEIIVECPELRLRFSYRDKEARLAIVSDLADR